MENKTSIMTGDLKKYFTLEIMFRKIVKKFKISVMNMNLKGLTRPERVNET